MCKMNNKISILAGNFRVSLNDQNEVEVDCQFFAFEAALRLAKKIQAKENYLPAISVAFDHIGVFRLQFLAKGLTNSQKRHPRLNNLHPVIKEMFYLIQENLIYLWNR